MWLGMITLYTLDTQCAMWVYTLQEIEIVLSGFIACEKTALITNAHIFSPTNNT